MTNPFPTRHAAFVVHLATDPDAPAGQARGRVEHVSTGRTARFESADELVRFMRGTLAAFAVQPALDQPRFAVQSGGDARADRRERIESLAPRVL